MGQQEYGSQICRYYHTDWERLSFPPFEKTYPTNSHVSFQKDIKAYVGINRVYFSEGG